ncbi:heme/hemin ABC transporter substrate-binding protein, partial [Rubrivirga sp.]|uniref:heme/hemin ABC transporter substrate-binding protein n=1 Tax=Rubrivirga sp. TaxID=1885344 RepID=UPI003C79012A
MLRLALLSTIVLAGCAAPERSEAVSAEASSERRIVTLGGPVTEITHALGLEGEVVGTDRSSLYPASILDKPRLDYFRQTSAEGVLSLNPTMVVAIEGTGPPGVLDQIRAAGVTVEVVPEVTDLEGAEDRVRRVAAIYGVGDQAEPVVAQMRSELGAVEPVEGVRALFVYARGAGVVMVSGTNNAADTVLRMAGAENVVTAFQDFRPLTAEAVADASPDVIVIPERGLESMGGIDGLLRQPGLAQTPAGQA